MGRGLQRPATETGPAVDVPALVSTPYFNFAPGACCYYPSLTPPPLPKNSPVVDCNQDVASVAGRHYYVRLNRDTCANVMTTGNGQMV